MAAGSVAAILMATGCAPSNESHTSLRDIDPEAARAYVFAQLSSSTHGVSTINAPRSVLEVLPNRRYLDPNGHELAYMSTLVIGTITSVEKGLALKHTGDDQAVRAEFDDPEASERSVVVTLRNLREVGTDVPETVQFTMGLHGAEDPEQYMAGLRSLGRVVVGLTTGEVLGVSFLRPALTETFIGPIDSTGRVSLPGLGEDAGAFLGAVTTEDQLVRAAQAPVTTGTITNH